MRNFVVKADARRNWFVEVDGDVVVTNCANWTSAREAAVELALREVEVGQVTVLKLLDNAVRAQFRPRRSKEATEAVLAAAAAAEAEKEPSILEDLENLSTIDLVAVYNACGGKIGGKYKGSRAALIEKIRAAQ